jgi:hypothetical protein
MVGAKDRSYIGILCYAIQKFFDGLIVFFIDKILYSKKFFQKSLLVRLKGENALKKNAISVA